MERLISFSTFIDALSGKRLIMLGEIHGTKEIPRIVKDILIALSKKQPISLFLEVPTDQQKHIDDYLHSRENISLYDIPFYKFHRRNNGRNSTEYLHLIKHIKGLNTKHSKQIKIFCVDPCRWDDKRDYKMYQNIKKLLSKQESLSIFIAGAVHSSTGVCRWKNKKIKSAGFFLKKFLREKVVSVRFIPLSGKFFNLGLRKITKRRKARSPRDSIIKLDGEKGYDYAYYLRKVSPCSFVK